MIKCLIVQGGMVSNLDFRLAIFSSLAGGSPDRAYRVCIHPQFYGYAFLDVRARVL